MKKCNYVLTLSAQKDLKEIAHYTLKTWGTRQSIRYAGLLEKRFQEIAAGTAVSKTFSALYPQIQVTHCEHHYIFYLHNEGQRPCIVAVLHDRMDLFTRLHNRLQ